MKSEIKPYFDILIEYQNSESNFKVKSYLEEKKYFGFLDEMKFVKVEGLNTDESVNYF